MNSKRKKSSRFLVTALASMVVVAWVAMSLVVLPVAIPEVIRWGEGNVGRELFWTIMIFQIGSGLLGVPLLVFFMYRYQRRRRMLVAGQARR